jgi:hypothetical protein
MMAEDETLNVLPSAPPFFLSSAPSGDNSMRADVDSVPVLSERCDYGDLLERIL